MILHFIHKVNLKLFLKLLMGIHIFSLCHSSFSNDIFDASKNILEINRVKVNDSLYFGIKLNPDKIISVKNDRSIINFDVFLKKLFNNPESKFINFIIIVLKEIAESGLVKLRTDN